MTIAAIASDLLSNLQAADTNGDGQLSFTEAVAQIPGLTASQFDTLDTNSDGGLSDAELRAAPNGDTTDGGCVLAKRVYNDTLAKWYGDSFLLGLTLTLLAGWRRVGMM